MTSPESLRAQPLVAICYARWKNMPWQQVLAEMSTLFHLAVKIDRVKALDHDR